MGNKDFSVIRKNGSLPNPRCIDASAIIPDLWEVYVDSATSLLNKLEACAIDLEAGNSPQENAASIRRILHSLKGDSGVTGLTDIYDLVHQAEFGFDELAGTDATDMLLKVKDWICEAINCIKRGETGVEEDNCRIDGQEPEDDLSQENYKVKALVIDDELVVRKLIEILLGEYCDITFASNGSEGIELFQKALEEGKPFSLVTLDIEMPIMNGHETLELIREIEKTHGITGLDGVKVVMSTSLQDPEHVFSAFREGCEAYVKKIEMNTKLVEEVKKLGIVPLGV